MIRRQSSPLPRFLPLAVCVLAVMACASLAAAANVTATRLDGTSVAFVLMADRVRFLKTFAAEGALDAAAAALGGCHCSVGGGR